MYSKYKERFSSALLKVEEGVYLINEALVTAEVYMNYVRTLRHYRNGTYLSASAYGVKRSSIFHLF
jgi:hypothetical protein